MQNYLLKYKIYINFQEYMLYKVWYIYIQLVHNKHL